MKIIIAGSRHFDDYELLKQVCDNKLCKLEDIEIVSGRASGADTLGEKYAKEKGYRLALFPADWKKYGRAAGPIRNLEMAKYADALIAFLAPDSRGTANMIKVAKQYNLKRYIHNVQ